MPIEIAGLKLYDVKEIAQAMKVSRITVRGYIEKGRLNAVKVGRSYRVTEDALKDFLLKRDKDTAEQLELKEIPTFDLGTIKDEALSRTSLYDEALDRRTGPR